jgi:ABC-2 type transport system permease protein
MMRILRIVGVCFKNALSGRMAYRMNFFLVMFTIMAFELLFPIVTILIYGNGLSFPGWGLYEVLLIQGVFLLSKGISLWIFIGMWTNVLSRVREGTFDLLLIRPASPMFLTIVTNFSIDEIGTLPAGILLTSISLRYVAAPGFANWIWFILLFLFSILILFSLTVIMSATVFKWVGNSRLGELFNVIYDFGNFPVTIFSKAFQILITWVIPIAMVAFLPVSVLLEKPIPNIVISICAGFGFFFVAIVFWRIMLRKYESAGG